MWHYTGKNPSKFPQGEIYPQYERKSWLPCFMYWHACFAPFAQLSAFLLLLSTPHGGNPYCATFSIILRRAAGANPYLFAVPPLWGFKVQPRTIPFIIQWPVHFQILLCAMARGIYPLMASLQVSVSSVGSDCGSEMLWPFIGSALPFSSLT